MGTYSVHNEALRHLMPQPNEAPTDMDLVDGRWDLPQHHSDPMQVQSSGQIAANESTPATHTTDATQPLQQLESSSDSQGQDVSSRVTQPIRNAATSDALAPTPSQQTYPDLVYSPGLNRQPLRVAATELGERARDVLEHYIGWVATTMVRPFAAVGRYVDGATTDMTPHVRTIVQAVRSTDATLSREFGLARIKRSHPFAEVSEGWKTVRASRGEADRAEAWRNLRRLSLSFAEAGARHTYHRLPTVAREIRDNLRPTIEATHSIMDIVDGEVNRLDTATLQLSRNMSNSQLVQRAVLPVASRGAHLARSAASGVRRIARNAKHRNKR